MKTPLRTRIFSLVSVATFAVVQFATAQSTWTGAGADQNWSTPGNWPGEIVPNNNAVTFPDGPFPATTNAQGVVNNIVQSSTTISSLTYNNQSSDFVTTEIPAGTTLTLSGGLTLGASDPMSVNTVVTLTGGGSLVAGTNGTSTLSGQNGSGQGSASVLNLYGLNDFSFNAGGSGGTINLGTGTSGSAITVTLAAVSNNITAATFNIGNNNTRGASIVNLGNGTNIINADTINMGFSKAAGTLQFFNNAGGGLTIANRAGTGRANINIGGQAGSGSTTAVNSGNVLLNGGSVNILANTIAIANRANRASGSANGTLAFDNGIVDATAVNMAINTSGGSAPTATVTVGANATLRVGNLSLANQGGTAGTGTLNINGGTVTSSGNIYKTTANGTATITMNQGNLILTGITSGIGVSNGITIDNLNIIDATLTLPVLGAGQPDVAVVNFTPAVAAATNIINISALPSVSTFPAQFPVISYITPGGDLSTIALGTLPIGFSGYISNNVTTSSIDLVLTNGPAAKADTWKGNVNSQWDTTTANWISGGNPATYVDLDQVTFDDSAVSANVTVTGTRIPATVNGLTFNNSALNYVLSGTGKISGPVQLVMNGSGSVTLSQSGGDNFSGGIQINAGKLILDNTNSSISGGMNIAGGATAQIGNNDANGALPAGPLDDEGTLIFSRTNNVLVGVGISGGGGLEQHGSGTLTLSANNGYFGNTVVSAGTLTLTGSGAIASSASVNVTSSTLDVSGVTSSASLNILNLTNSTLNVKVGYLQTNLNVTGLNMGGTGNTINVQSLPPIASYPATIGLLQSASPIVGYNFTLGTLPTASPAYAGTIALSGDGTAVLLTLTAGPIGTRPSVTWVGTDALSGVNTNWSDAQNWQTPGIPTVAESVTFNNNATGGGTPFDVIGNGPGGVPNAFNIDNIVDINVTNAALSYVNSGGTFHNTEILPSKTLAVNGTFGVTGAAGNVTILGTNGTLVITNNTTLNVQNTTAPTLDLSGLDILNATAGQINIGGSSAGNLYLARTNTVRTGAGFFGVGSSLIVGGGAANSTAQLFLGQSNALYVDGITLGINLSTADLIEFNPSFSNTPVAYIRGILGDSSRVSSWSLGDASVNLNNNVPGGNLVNDFSAGRLDALVSTLTVGMGSQGNIAPTLTTKATFNMGLGNLDVTTLKIGVPGSGNPGGLGAGIMNVTGGTVVANTVGIAASALTGTGATTTTGMLNLTNASLTVSNGITASATTGGATLNIVSSHLNLLNNGTAGSPAAPLLALDLEGSTLRMDVDGNAVQPDVVATTITTGAPTTINIGTIVNVTAPVQMPLIGYTGTDPFPALTLGTYPAGYTATLVDNQGSATIDISLTPTGGGVPPTPGITGIHISGTTLSLTATNGAVNGPFVLLGTTNVALPVAQWTPVLTNNFDGSGNLNLSTNIIDPSLPRQFYILLQQ